MEGLQRRITVSGSMPLPDPCCDAAIAVWTQTGDVDHAWIIGSYFHYSVPNGWTSPQAKDISPAGGIFGRGDPMYVAYAHKKA